MKMQVNWFRELTVSPVTLPDAEYALNVGTVSE